MLSVTVENYLKQLYMAQQGDPEALVGMGTLADSTGVTPGTATSMVKSLAKGGLVDYEPRRGCRLTAEGEALALSILRRHRLIELFLVQVLGLSWSEVHEEAEVLEHAVSERVLGCMDELLGRPDYDPHGDPIPAAGGGMPPEERSRLLQHQVNERLRIARVLDESPAFLHFLDRHRLGIGTEIQVLSREPAVDAMVIGAEGGKPVTLGLTAAAKILVEALD